MTKLSRSNIFEAGAAEIPELFGDYIEADGSEGDLLTLVVYGRAPSGAARNAVEKSLAALGFGDGRCAFVSLAPLDPSVEGGDIPLDAQALFLVVEGLDPVRVISTDQQASDVLCAAYRASVRTDCAARLFGRPSVLFRDLSQLVQSDDGKQKAWALFKTLA